MFFYVMIVGFIAVFAAPLPMALACILVPSLLAALIAGIVDLTYHRENPVVIAGSLEAASALNARTTCTASSLSTAHSAARNAAPCIWSTTMANSG
ncbi:MAG TPA: hypothetical protein VHN77_08610 [Phycisphaerales bacterium]|nr:hypothetical protein [Phycisphaerales bacterium]